MSTQRKQALVAQLLEQLGAEIERMTKAARDAHEAATHEEAKPENDKDTRGLEAAYLAGAQAERVRELELAAKRIASLDLRDLGDGDVISASALVTLEDEDGARTRYFLAPHGGGLRLALDGAPVQVVTPQSPLGQALLGKARGDVVELRAKSGTREMEIVAVD